MIVPKVFVSYSHDSLQHKKWVLELAIRLRNNGIDAILDQFELKPGDDIPHFMETHLANCDKILMICTENYVGKANKGEGGVGYEKMIITSNLIKRIDENKIIPIVRQTSSINIPTFLKTKFYISFNVDIDFEFSYDDLIRSIHNSPLFIKPPVGNNPFEPVQKEDKEENIALLNDIIKLAVKEYNKQNNPVTRWISTSDVMEEYKMSRILAEVTFKRLVDLGLVKWKLINEHIELTENGKFYAVKNNLY